VVQSSCQDECGKDRQIAAVFAFFDPRSTLWIFGLTEQETIMKRILVIDGQGGRLGALVIEELKKAQGPSKVPEEK